jgi:superoxide dismutase, Fe-Mn family
MTEYQVLTMDRRAFLAGVGAAGAALTVALGNNSTLFAAENSGNKIQLPKLPYDMDALEPHLSKKTLEFHYGKHHQGYVNNTLQMIAGTKYEKASLGEIIKSTAGKPDSTALFNNAAQSFNHTYYWYSMKPQGGGKPQGRLAAELFKFFGDIDAFVKEFTDAAASQFGSGWAWLVQDKKGLKVVKTANADTPIAHDMKPLLVIDVWEHAYYLDYQNRRPDYIKAFVNSLINWDFAARNMESADFYC